MTAPSDPDRGGADRVVRWAAALAVAAALAPAIVVTLDRLGLGPAVAAAIGLAVTGAAGWGLGGGLARALPRLGVAARAPGHRRVWLAVTAVGLVQLARASAFTIAPDVRAASPTLRGTDHQCLAAYARGAELAGHGADGLYDPRRYDAGAAGLAATDEPGLADHLGDPFQYPPPFLIAPALGLGVAADYHHLRALWFTAQMLVLLALATAIARRAGPAGVIAVPVMLASLPFVINVAYGQAHLVVLAAGVAGVAVAGERGAPAPPSRQAAAGLLLAAATVAKLFPGIGAIVLLGRRRFGALAWAAAWGAILVVASILVHGTAPLAEFVTVQLPRLVGGGAFSDFVDSSQYRLTNLSAGSVPDKLAVIAPALAPLAGPVGRILGGAFAVAVVVAAARIGARATGPRAPAAVLAVFVLASLVGDYAPATYMMAPAIWLLGLAAAERTLGRAVSARAWLGWAAAWALLSLVPFALWMPVLWDRPAAVAALALVAQIGVFSGAGAIVWYGRTGRD